MKRLAGSTTKKVLIRRVQREALAGYVNPATYLQPHGLEMLSIDGQVALIPYAEVQSVGFVREFATAAEPDRMTFNTRPKMEGLWVSLRFRDGAVMEGVLPNNLLQLDAYGFTIIPPDPYSNTQRVFVPKSALIGVEVLGVVGSPLTKKRKGKPEAKDQIGLFDQQ